MDSKNYKEICKFIKDCAKLGVTSLKVGDLEFKLDLSGGYQQVAREYNPAKLRKLAKNADRITTEGEELEDAEQDELRMSQLVVDDFEAFEKESLKRLQGDA